MVNLLSKTFVEPVVDANDVSRIAEGVVIRGDISSRSDIRVDGQMNGKLFSQGRVVVGETAVLKGSLLCENVDFWGSMEGDVYVRDVLSIKSSAVISGNVYVRRIQVEMGAQINGTCHMISEAEFDKLAGEVVDIQLPKPQPQPKPQPKLFDKPKADPAPVKVDVND